MSWTGISPSVQYVEVEIHIVVFFLCLGSTIIVRLFFSLHLDPWDGIRVQVVAESALKYDRAVIYVHPWPFDFVPGGWCSLTLIVVISRIMHVYAAHWSLCESLAAIREALSKAVHCSLIRTCFRHKRILWYHTLEFYVTALHYYIFCCWGFL